MVHGRLTELDRVQQGLEEGSPAGEELHSCPRPADFSVAGAEERKVQLSLWSGERLLTPVLL